MPFHVLQCLPIFKGHLEASWDPDNVWMGLESSDKLPGGPDMLTPEQKFEKQSFMSLISVLTLKPCQEL